MRGLFSLIVQQHAHHVGHDCRRNVHNEDARVPRVARPHDGRDESQQDDGADDEFQGFHRNLSLPVSVATAQPPTFRTVSVEHPLFFHGEFFQTMLA